MFFFRFIKIVYTGQGPVKQMPVLSCSYIRLLQIRSIKNYSTAKKNLNFHVKSADTEIRAIYTRGLHTSAPRKGLPPHIWQIIFNVLRALAITAGRNWRLGSRGFRRRRFGKVKLAVGGVVAGALGYLFYIVHLEECPITKRKKFVIFSERSIMKMATRESENVRRNFQGKVKRSGTDYEHVLDITGRILEANKHLPGIKKNWRVFVIKDRKINNAFVLPNGDIFIFTGMLEVVDNEDQLATIMGHEIAHALLNHVGEAVSKTHLFQFILLLPMFVLWTILPDAIAMSSEVISGHISEILFRLPMSRQLETEADVVGLKMMARACYDPRQALELWKLMATLSRGEPTEWLSTHPSHRTRSKTLAKLMPEAMGIYTKHCKS